MTTNAPIPLTADQIAALNALKMSRRAVIVRDTILANGSVTTDDLKELGYEHPPRAVRDLREAGASVAMQMERVAGKRMARYYFDGGANRDAKGALPRPKAFDDKLKADFGHRCNICSGVFAARALQIDHRVPYEIAGDPDVNSPDTYQPLCAPDNRAKSWSCENCPNWTIRNVDTCKGCFWASPENYSHVETRPERRLNLIFQGAAAVHYDDMHAEASQAGLSMQEYVTDKLA